MSLDAHGPAIEHPYESGTVGNGSTSRVNGWHPLITTEMSEGCDPPLFAFGGIDPRAPFAGLVLLVHRYSYPDSYASRNRSEAA